MICVESDLKLNEMKMKGKGTKDGAEPCGDCCQRRLRLKERVASEFI